MINSSVLLRDLHHEVRALMADLRERHPDDPAEKIEQAATAWVMATIFIRYSEDNRLIDIAYLAGAPDRLQLALDQQMAYFTQHPEHGDRDWIIAAVDRLSASAATMRLFDGLYGLIQGYPVSQEAAGRLIGFWRRIDAAGQLVHEFTDPGFDAVVLSDLYAGLSDSARVTYALVVTPGFVADFIVNRTVQPAITAFGSHGLRVIDPVCGSGTFLLRAFRLVLAARQTNRPGAAPWDLVSESLASVHGADKNPLAVTVCRFRLLLAAMAAAGARQLAEVPALPLIVATADSLLLSEQTDEYPGVRDHSGPGNYPAPEVNLLGRGSYHAVIGNPPYMTVRDRATDQVYRSLYSVCRGKYALTVPFIVRFFQLAREGGENAGFVGLIVSNSFMKREFGRPLVEEFLPQVDLTDVVDTSGAYIPGHGTPTAILIGRMRAPSATPVRTVMGVRNQPVEPVDPQRGVVWTAIEGQVDRPGSVSEWISVRDVERERFARHPWVLTGSAASDLLATLEGRPRLASLTARIGYVAATGADDAFIAPGSVFRRLALEEEAVRPIVTGSDVRDWGVTSDAAGFFPVTRGGAVLDLWRLPRHERRLWPYRTTLGSRRLFGGQRLADTGHPWWSWHQVTHTPDAHPWSIVFAWVATLGHFALLPEHAVPLQSAPVIKLPAMAGQDDIFSLLAALNSSVVCFWLKQRSQAKGAPRADQLRAEEAWDQLYEFTATGLGDTPVPDRIPANRGAELTALAERLATATSADEHQRLHGRMVARQEELDWEAYYRYGLLTEAGAARLVAEPDAVPEIRPGERAFEIVMARRMAAGDLDTRWFNRHGSAPMTEIPPRWPDAYRRIVAKRIEYIAQDRNIGLIERPEYKRRWPPASWAQHEEERLKAWLLDRCEQRDLWFDESGQPRPLTVSTLADRLRGDAAADAVVRRLAGDDADMVQVIGDLIDIEHVPYLAQFRYKASGLAKRAMWEQTWDRQRAEDRSMKWADIPVPPNYTSADFLRPSFWRNRGKLDIARERFISYPGASPGHDDPLLLGWAGWDHREQAHVLVTLIDDRATTDGWGKDRLTPLIAGLAEIMPWVRQWHSEPTEFGESWADAYDGFLAGQRERHGLTSEGLQAWKAPAPRRGRPPKKSDTSPPKGG